MMRSILVGVALLVACSGSDRPVAESAPVAQPAHESAPPDAPSEAGEGGASEEVSPSVPPPASGDDRDGDGIGDSTDRCPDEPEYRDGMQDEDGCPEADNDQDGILDINDRCPNQPESKNGRQDEDGCPE
jgi:hypothetical protein